MKIDDGITGFRIAPFGVPLRFHWSTLLVAGLFLFQAGFLGLAQFAIIVISVIFHEYAHVWQAQREGLYVHDVVILAIGGMARIQPGAFNTPGPEFRIAAVGPVSSLLLAGVGFGLFQLFPNYITASIFYINLILGIFNLLPIYPMDGGRMLNALFTKYMGVLKAVKVSVIVTSILGGLLVVYGLYIGSWWLAIIMGLIIMMAWQSKRALEMQGAEPPMM